MSTTTPSPAAAVAAAAAGATRICFNAHCKEPISDPPGPRRRGWRLRSGDYADLCERCFIAYEQGNFCDTFHADATGWRICETCGKRLHCGCIVSATIYYLLDAGGVDCVACARKALGMAPNQMLSSPMLTHQQGYERREFTTKNWRPTSGPFPGQWRQGSHIWNLTSTQTDLQQRLSFEFDRPSADRLISGGRLSVMGHEKKFEEPPERIITTSLGKVSRDKYTNESTGSEPISTFNTYHREEANTGMQESCNLVAEHEPNSTRKADVPDPSTSSSCVKLEMNPNPIVNSQSPTTLKEESPSLLIGLAASLSSANGSKDTSRFSSSQAPRQITPQLSKQFFSQGVIDAESQSQMRNGRPRMDTRTRTQLLPRYWPRITDQELQQISGDSNAVIIPLFEKMLSASDAGRIGRLVLPKKCAEAYFPTISQPEGLPLTVQDATGKEWVFQFRFWPNNNSRMYVLEGVTPCIQSMQLQAGDTVTFSRLDPEGKLIMGFRKASSVASEQESQTPSAANGGSTPPEGNNRTTTIDLSMNIPLHAPKSSLETVNPIGATEEPTLSKFAKAGFIKKDGSAAKSSPVPGKRKASTLGPKNKRLHIENEDSKELKLTWEEAQELLRPAPNSVPNVVVIDGHEVEEYEEAPVLGRRTYFTKNQAGENFQWAQCDVCSKWRKLPVDVLLPFRWTCSDNKWDPEYKRSSCSSAQELSLEQILDLVPTKTGASKRAKVKAEAASIEASGGLDTLANIALGEGENQPSTSQQTTKHPRHRPGCSCIVCIQPPSGKGPKHKQTCTCNVCLTVKRRFRTLMLRREKRQSEKEAENARKQQEVKQSTGPLPHGEGSPSSPGVVANGSPQKADTNNDVFLDEGSEHRRTSLSPLKAPQIDLNIQPEREEESSPRSDVGNIARLLRDATA